MPGRYDPLDRRAREKWMQMVWELEDMGFTYSEGKSVWIFRCSHKGKVELKVSRTMRAYQDGKWNHIVIQARLDEQRVCRVRWLRE